MRWVGAVAAVWMGAGTALANPDIDALVDAMGVPALVRAFSAEGAAAGANLDAEFLNGQGGAVWAETVRKLYDPERLEGALRIGLAEVLDPQVARTALLFFDSDVGQRVITIEVQAREAMIDPDVAEMAEAAAAQADPAAKVQVMHFLELRDLIERNTETGLSAQVAFFDGYAQATRSAQPAPDMDRLRAGIAAQTESWLMGYYTLVQSALGADDINTYSDFWRTDVGTAVDEAVFKAFGDTYTTLSFGLGQAVGVMAPPNEL